jgi:NADH dehydrogenase (ubiquinone) Fe-S protein 3
MDNTLYRVCQNIFNSEFSTRFSSLSIRASLDILLCSNLRRKTAPIGPMLTTSRFSVWKDELTIHVPPSAIIPVFNFLKFHTACEYTQVSDITAVDYPTKHARFEVVYNLLSVRHNARLRVKTYADEATPVPSITPLYDGANWYEREVYDLFGVFFVDHPDLRRIMTDYGFDGHPLRKDFPMTGYTEIRFDEEKKRIVVEPLEMTQAYRNFRGGSSAWEQVGEGRDDKPEAFKLPTPKPEPPKEEDKKK